MSAQNSKGIQTLLDVSKSAAYNNPLTPYLLTNHPKAEREAQKIVQKAREYRTRRVKDARTEAQREIDDYRQQKDDEFKKFEKEVRLVSASKPEHTRGNKKAEEDASRDAEEQLNAIRASGDKSGQKVIEDLLKAVTDVRPEVPDRVSAPTQA
ncbi:MAG: hypothetical protein LQ351_000968 [Letrouitia transgressa]|nr:MAG: hypothetical protein LQ351_000968 [Letrouitia transgressa]